MEPLDFLRVLKQRWKIIVAALVFAGAAAWMTTPAKVTYGPPVLSYTASATLLQEPGAEVSLPYVALLASKGRIPTVAAQTLGYTDDPALLASSVSIVPDTDVGTLTITSSDSDGDHAAEVANAFADATITVLAQDAAKQRKATIDELQTSITDNQAKLTQLEGKLKNSPDDILLKAQLSAYEQQLTAATSQLVTLYGQAGQGAELTVLQEATPLPVVSGGGFSAPSSRTGRLALGLVVGSILGLLLVLLMDRLDTKLRRREDLESVYRLPVVAEIPRTSRRRRKKAAVEALRNPAGPLAESYRSLRTSLALLPSRPLSMPTWGEPDPKPAGAQGELPQVPQVILVTSARASEGKSTTAALLAAALAETGKRVLVVDADFHNPSMHKMLDVTPGPGLADLLDLESETQLPMLTRPTDQSRIRLLTAGDAEHYRGALPARIAIAVSQARAYAEIVIIDAAPVLHTNDALDFMPYVDTVVVVARLGKVTRAQASRVADLLGRTRAPVLGVVAIGSRNSGYGYGYGYGRSKSSDSSRARRRRAAKDAKKVATP